MPKKKSPALPKIKPDANKITECKYHGVKHKLDGLCCHPVCLKTLIDRKRRGNKRLDYLYRTAQGLGEYSDEDMTVFILRPVLQAKKRGEAAILSSNSINSALVDLLRRLTAKSKTVKSDDSEVRQAVFEELDTLTNLMGDNYSDIEAQVFVNEVKSLIQSKYGNHYIHWLTGEMDNTSFSKLVGIPVHKLGLYRKEVCETIKDILEAVSIPGEY